MATEVVLVIGDLHCGSSVALMPPRYVDPDGCVHTQSKTQGWLWECWTDLIGRWLPERLQGRPFALVVNGDAIEGVHHGTTQLVTNDPGDHVSIALEVLAPLSEQASNIFMVRGTRVHVGNSERGLGAALGAIPNPDTGSAWDRLPLTVRGCRTILRHHIGTSTRLALYATQLGVALAEEQVQAARFGQPIPSVLCCAHRHTFGQYRDDKALCVTGSPWQVLTTFGHQVASASIVGCGAYLLDWGGVDAGGLPAVHAMVYRPELDKGYNLDESVYG